MNKPPKTIGEILTVKKVERGGSGWGCHCPHCKEFVSLPSGPVRGEQFTHKECGGVFDVAHDAKATGP